MKQRYFSLYYNTEILQYITANISKINHNTLIMALIIPSSASWCDCNTKNNSRNIIHIDRQYIKKYTNVLNVSDRIFRESVKQLDKLNILKKDNKGKNDYFLNPWWASTGEDAEVQEFRAWCTENRIFKPPSIRNWNDETEYTDRLTKAVDSTPSKERHSCVYLSLDNVDKFLAFTASDRKKLNSTDIILFIYFAIMCKFVKSIKIKENCNTIHVAREDQRNIEQYFGISERTVRNSLVRLQQYHLIYKVKTSVYMVNPFVCAKGTWNKIDKFRDWVINIDSEYFGIYANGELDRAKNEDSIIYTEKTTGEIIRQIIL